MIRICSHLQNLNGQFTERFAQGKKALRGNPAPWMVIEPIMNEPDYIHFETDELVMLLGLKDFELFNDLADMDERHNGTLKAISVYNERRLALTPLLPADSFNGKVGSGWSDDPRFFALMPRIIEVDSLINAIMPQCPSQAKDASGALDRLAKLLASKVGLAITPETLSDAELLANGTEHGAMDNQQ